MKISAELSFLTPIHQRSLKPLTTRESSLKEEPLAKLLPAREALRRWWLGC
jgi:hypothetical protein